MTRANQHQKNGTEPDLPPPGPAAYLIGYLFSVGPVMAGGMGPVPITSAELAAWQANTGRDLTAWESDTLRTLSAAWASATNDARSADCPAPWVPEAIEQNDRERVARKVTAILGSRSRGSAPAASDLSQKGA